MEQKECIDQRNQQKERQGGRQRCVTAGTEDSKRLKETCNVASFWAHTGADTAHLFPQKPAGTALDRFLGIIKADQTPGELRNHANGKGCSTALRSLLISYLLSLPRASL